MRPKRHKKQIKIEDKNKEEKISFSRSSWGGLGTILERSWDPSLVSQVCVLLGVSTFVEYHVFLVEKIRF